MGAGNASAKNEIDPRTVRGSAWRALRPPDRRLLLDRAFQFWRHHGFPYYQLSRLAVINEFKALKSRSVLPLGANGFGGSNIGLRVANSFHPQMWSVRVSRYRSPMDVFLDDELLLLALERSWNIWPDRFGANEATLRRMLKTFPGSASVSNFRPTAARNIIGSFSNDGEFVLDFSAGYGGRLLGALSLPRHYHGIDPCGQQIAGLRSLWETFASQQPQPGSARLQQGCAEDVLPTLPSKVFDLIFSSPPYFDWEKYSHEPTQSFVRFPAYSQWLQGFLQPSIEESYRLLRRGGRLALNISGRLRRPATEEVISFAARAGFRLEHSIPIRLARVPYMHPRAAGPNKLEELLIWVKP